MTEPQKSERPRAGGLSTSDKPITQLRVTATHETVRKLVKAGGADARVWLALSLYADWNTGRCFPSYRKLQDDTGLGRASIARCMRSLEAAGLIYREARPGWVTTYVLAGVPRLTGETGKPGDPSHGRDHPRLMDETGTRLTDETQNESQGTSVKTDGEAPPAAAPPEVQVADRIRGRKTIRYASPLQLAREASALVAELGLKDALAFVDGAKSKDILKLPSEAVKWRTRAPPARRPPDPGCPNCGGRGRRKNPSTGGEFDCGCTAPPRGGG